MAKTIEQLREETFVEAMNILGEYKRCAIIRPTGFGKTGILTRIISCYRNVLYLYPAEVVRDAVLRFYYGEVPANREIPNVTFMTYSAVGRFAKNDLTQNELDKLDSLRNVDLIICDECHRLGATCLSVGLDKILDHVPNVDMVGATATPERMDMIDEISMFFDDHVVSEYNLHNAIQDGHLIKPKYVYCNYAEVGENEAIVKQELEKELEKYRYTNDLEKIYEHVNHSIVEKSNIYNMPNTIREVIDENVENTKYLRFIVFFKRFINVKENGRKVIQWFHEAYPDHKIFVTEVTSKTDETIENAKKLDQLPIEDNRIDLIFSCDMMNMGYHVNELTGIIMYRGTKSGIIYTQQLGRVLSTGADRAGIVFDVVDNIHVESLYSLLGKRTVDYEWRKKRLAYLNKKKQVWDAYTELKEKDKITPKDIEKVVEENSLLGRKDIKRIMEYIEADAEPPEWTKMDEKEVKKIKKKIKEEPEDVDAEFGNVRTEIEGKDLDVIDKTASYRDLIRKTVAEFKAMRCRQAWARWLEEGGIDHAQDGRPLSRQEVLNQLPPERIPLPPFCYSKQVSVEAVLDEMGIAS